MNQSDQLPHVALLVTDLDNTLYDWFAMWYPSFDGMFEMVSSSSGIPRDVLLKEAREVHQRRGTSEYSYLLNELPSLIKLHPDQNISTVYADAIHRYRSVRKSEMHLYPGVEESLRRIKELNVPIVAYTESLAYYSSWRIRELGLDGMIDYLYSPPDHDFPEGVTPDQLRTQAPESYELKETCHRFTPLGVLKPDDQVLQAILDERGVSASETVYVGDSLMKDVAMAQRIGAIDVLAEYGAVQDHAKYGLLRQVSHWTQDDVRREHEINARPHVAPTYVLHERFDEIFQFFSFGNQKKR